MAISANAISPTQSNPFAALAGTMNNPTGGTQNMSGMTGFPGLNLQSVSTNPISVGTGQANPQGILDLLSQASPQSLTALLMPLYGQLFNTQSGALSQQRDLQASQGTSQAQSDAMKRGLTGSSIEESGIQQALSNANQNYTQGYSGLLGNLVNSYAGAAGQDVASQTDYYRTLAQALGQTYASDIQQKQFAQQLQAGLDIAKKNSQSSLWGGIAGGIGSVAGGILGAYFGPAGAVAGSAAGNKLGSSIGGNKG